MDSKNIVPRFEFGFGLSYTTFEYSSLSITDSGSSKVVSFRIMNTGKLKGTEKPQLYLGYPVGAGEPPRVLRGFDEVDLDVGTSSTVKLTLSQRDFR
jgi:beta-glucosidase